MINIEVHRAKKVQELKDILNVFDNQKMKAIRYALLALENPETPEKQTMETCHYLSARVSEACDQLYQLNGVLTPVIDWTEQGAKEKINA